MPWSMFHPFFQNLSNPFSLFVRSLPTVAGFSYMKNALLIGALKNEMKNFDLISRSVSGSPEGAAAFMMEIFILGFNLAVECMETGDMAPDAAVLERYFVWFLDKESDAAGRKCPWY